MERPWETRPTGADKHPGKEGSKEGWGVGLRFVRSVAESHGGSIMVDSSAERGTTFFLNMPVDARPYQRALDPL